MCEQRRLWCACVWRRHGRAYVVQICDKYQISWTGSYISQLSLLNKRDGHVKTILWKMELKLIYGGLFFLVVLDVTRCFLLDSPNSTFTALTSKEFDQLLDLVMQEQKSRYNLEHYVGILENKYHELETKFHDLSVANAGLLSSNKVLESMNHNLSVMLTARTDMLEQGLRNQSMSTARLDKVLSENAVKMNASIEHLLQSNGNRNGKCTLTKTNY